MVLDGFVLFCCDNGSEITLWSRNLRWAELLFSLPSCHRTGGFNSETSTGTYLISAVKYAVCKSPSLRGWLTDNDSLLPG